MTLTSGTPLGSYVILAPLGSGGMGEVYKARDTRLNRLVAIKVLAPAMKQDPSALARFEREARILAGLNHPNIVAIHDVGSDAASPYVVTELLEGETLADLLKKEALTLSRAIGLTLQIADGLVAAHARGVVHRDLKPSNIFIGRDDRVKILDFGLAKDLHLDMETTMSGALPVPGMTLKGTVMGTVGYMSPEQVRGEAADIRSDLFTLGVLLLEMLTGRQAFTGDSAVEVLHAILRADPIEGQALPPELLPILQRLLAKNPEDRFQTARDLRFALANSPSGSSVAPVQPSRRRLIRPLGAAVGLGLVTLAVVWGLRVSSQPRPLPNWTSVTAIPGLVSAGRFSSDGRVVAYSMRGPDGHNLISTYSESDAFPHPTGRSGRVLALGAGNELFLAEPEGYAVNHGGLSWGDLQEWSGPQTGARTLAENVHDADLHPNGRDLALIRNPSGDVGMGADSSCTLEAPAGRVLVRIGGWASSPRWGRDGRSIAYIARRESSWAGQVVVIDPTGKEIFRSPYLRHIRGLAWAPDGQSLLFGHSPKPEVLPRIVAMDLKGQIQELLSAPTGLILLDVDPRGRLLVLTNSNSLHLRQEEQGQISTPRLPFELAAGVSPVISPDGQKVALVARESAISHTIYIRNRGDGGLVRLIPNASPLAFSNDNRWLLIQKFNMAQNRQTGFWLVPLGSGAERALNSEGIGEAQSGILPDMDHPVVTVHTPGGIDLPLYRLRPEGPPLPVAPALKNLLTFVHGGQDTYFAYDTKQGLFRGSLEKNQWVQVRGDLAKFIPLARDPASRDLLVTPAASFTPWDDLKPIGQLSLFRMTTGGTTVRLDRVLDLTGMGVGLEKISYSAGSIAFRQVEFLDRLMIVDGVLPGFRK